MNLDNTLEDLVEKIQAEHNVVDEIDLHIDWKDDLDRSMTLRNAKVDITNNVVVRSKVPITIVMPTKTLKLNVDLFRTVANFKQFIQDCFNIPVEDQQISKDGMVFQDSDTLAQANVHAQDLLLVQNLNQS